jgi:hypothetical protein
MNRSTIAKSLFATGLIVAAAVLCTVNADEDEKKTPPATPKEQSDQELKAFMRKKLDASSKILEGLALEDPALMKEGAQQLAKMSGAEQWHVFMDPVYRQLSNDFHRTANELVEAAEQGNTDRAALRWMDATLSCIKCHRYTRGMLVADEIPAR